MHLFYVTNYQNIEKPLYILYLENQMKVLNINTSDAVIKTLEKRYQTRKEKEKSIFGLNEKFDSLNITKLIRYTFQNKNEEIILASKN